MAKPKGKGRGAKPSKQSTKHDAKDELYSDELDDFQKQRDKISLDASDDPMSADELDDEAVYDLSDDNDDDSDDDDVDDDEDALDDAIERGGDMAELAKQAKQLGRKLKLQQKEDEEGGSDEEAGPGDKLWGASKKAYYADGDEYEDEEAYKEEEQEVLRLEKERAAGLSAQDFGLSEDEDEEGSSDDDEEEETMGQAAAKAGKRGGMRVEAVAKDLGALSEEQRQAALMSDAPELMALLGDLQASLAEVRHRVGPLLEEVRSGHLATSDGLSYLEAKHLLLLNYCINITFYLMMKAEGRSVKDHPVIARLVQLRTYLEKVRPIDKQLHYQIEKLLRATAAAQAEGEGGRQAGPAAGGAPAGVSEADMLRYGPKPDALLPKAGSAAAAAAAAAAGDDEQQEDGGGVYRPPKINPVSMDGDGSGLSAKEQRRLKEAKRRAGGNTMLKEYAQELLGAPEEIRDTQPGWDSAAAIRQRQRMEARAAVEEDMMTRVPLSRQEVKKLKAQQRAGLSTGGFFDDFADEVTELVDTSRGAGLSDLFNRHKLSQKFGADMEAGGKKGLGSGDADLPRRVDLAERRRQHDSKAAKRAAAAMDDDEPGPSREREEDTMYTAARDASRAKKKAREDRYAVPDTTLPPLPDPSAEGGRKISKAIEKNRGLTPHRSNAIKNPRVKHKLKFQKAMTKRKSVIPEQRSQARPYGGESTGIKAKLAKSTRLG